jgi:hypothetical protein
LSLYRLQFDYFFSFLSTASSCLMLCFFNELPLSWRLREFSLRIIKFFFGWCEKHEL